MGYEIPGSIGIKLAAPERRVFTLIGDGTWLMLSSELATAVAERIPLTVILVDNQGYMSIGALSRSLGQAGFGTHFKRAVNGGPILDAAGWAWPGDGGSSACRSTLPRAPRAWGRR